MIELVQEDLLVRVADVLMALSNVSLGDYSVRVDIGDDDHTAVAELLDGINGMIASLAAEHARIDSYREELEGKLATIEQQRAAIRELSTPILEVWQGVLCLPVVGVLDTVRSSEMTSQLLDAIVEHQTSCSIIDVTGIDVMDTSTAEHFIRMGHAAQLLGSLSVLTGLNPTIAQTVVHMGIALAGIVTYRTLRDALRAEIGGLTTRREVPAR
jgi:rsbT co-antagonist protein RsbR